MQQYQTESAALNAILDIHNSEVRAEIESQIARAADGGEACMIEARTLARNWCARTELARALEIIASIDLVGIRCNAAGDVVVRAGNAKAEIVERFASESDAKAFAADYAWQYSNGLVIVFADGSVDDGIRRRLDPSDLIDAHITDPRVDRCDWDGVWPLLDSDGFIVDTITSDSVEVLKLVPARWNGEVLVATDPEQHAEAYAFAASIGGRE